MYDPDRRRDKLYRAPTEEQKRKKRTGLKTGHYNGSLPQKAATTTTEAEGYWIKPTVGVGSVPAGASLIGPN